MRLALFIAIAAACDAQAPPPASCPPRLASPVVLPAPAPQPVVQAAPAHVVELSSVVWPPPAFEVVRRPHLDNPYLDGASSMISRGGHAGDPGAAVQAALAVAFDPSSAVARFVEACALAQIGEHVWAEKVLEILHAQPGCARCRDALVNIEASPCRFDATAIALAKDVEPSAMRRAAEAVIASLDSGDDKAIEPYLDDGGVRIDSECSVCDAGTPASTVRHTRAQFIAFIRAAGERIERGPYSYRRPVLLFCDGACCTGPTGMLSHTQLFVTSVCFRGTTAAPKLASIDVIDGG